MLLWESSNLVKSGVQAESGHLQGWDWLSSHGGGQAHTEKQLKPSFTNTPVAASSISPRQTQKHTGWWKSGAGIATHSPRVGMPASEPKPLSFRVVTIQCKALAVWATWKACPKKDLVGTCCPRIMYPLVPPHPDGEAGSLVGWPWSQVTKHPGFPSSNSQHSVPFES
jgi:hypothetical protein